LSALITKELAIADKVAQAGEHLPSKHKALSSNPTTTKENKQTKNSRQY
jgi:hypothetical protein